MMMPMRAMAMMRRVFQQKELLCLKFKNFSSYYLNKVLLILVCFENIFLFLIGNSIEQQQNYNYIY